jgi:hypothetical protein
LGKNITELEFKAPKRIYATGIPFVQVFELGNDIIVNVSDTICAGDSVVVGNSVYYQTGVYTAIFPLAPAIDSIVITTLTVNPFRFCCQRVGYFSMHRRFSSTYLAAVQILMFGIMQ